MRKPFEQAARKNREEEFLNGGSADNTLPRTKGKPADELFKTCSFTLPPASLNTIKQTQLRLMQAGSDSPNRSDVVRMALAYLNTASDHDLEMLFSKSKP